MTVTTDDQWGRLDRLPQFAGLAGVYNLGVELRRAGHDPLTLGLLDARAALTADETTMIPVIRDLGLDLTIPGEVSIVRGTENVFADSHRVLATGSFVDDHPQVWLDALAEYEQAALIVSPKTPSSYATVEEWLTDSLLGIIGVNYWVNDEGFSLAPTGGSRS